MSPDDGPPAGKGPQDERPWASGSIIERYRGTEFDSRAALPEPAPKTMGARLAPFLAVAGFVVLVAAIAGTVLVVLMQGQPPSAAATATPGPATPKRDAARVTDALWNTLQVGTLSYHVEGTGSSSSKDFAETFSLSLDVVGDDFTGEVTTTPGTGPALFLRHEGVVYAKLDGETLWHSLATSERLLRQAPLMGVDDPRAIAYDGVIVENGQTLHRFVSTGVYAPSVERLLDLSAFRFPNPTLRLELYVTDAGVPVRALFTCTAAADAVTGAPAFDGSATYTFSKFGQPVTITAPKL